MKELIQERVAHLLEQEKIQLQYLEKLHQDLRTTQGNLRFIQGAREQLEWLMNQPEDHPETHCGAEDFAKTVNGQSD